MSSYILYGIPNCNTVKKAMVWLKTKNVEYVFHNFKKDGITSQLLENWFKTFGWENVINKKGLTFKKLDKEAQALIINSGAALTYLLSNTSAIKRPILEENGNPVLIGFTEEDYAKKLP